MHQNIRRKSKCYPKQNSPQAGIRNPNSVARPSGTGAKFNGEPITETVNLVQDFVAAVKIISGEDPPYSVKLAENQGVEYCLNYRMSHPDVECFCCLILIDSRNIIFGGREIIAYELYSVDIANCSACAEKEERAFNKTPERIYNRDNYLPRKADNIMRLGEKIEPITKKYKFGN